MVHFAANFGCCIFFLHLGIDYNMVDAKQEPIAEFAVILLLPYLNWSASFIKTVNSKKQIRVANSRYLNCIALHRTRVVRRINSFLRM